MSRGLLMHMPLLAFAASIASLAFTQSSAGRQQFLGLIGVDSRTAHSSYFKQPVLVALPRSPQPSTGEAS
jgi:hypothetical protein